MLLIQARVLSRYSESLAPNPAASMLARRVVRSAKAGATFSKSPAANSVVLAPMAAMLSPMVSNAWVERSMTPGRPPSWLRAMSSSTPMARRSGSNSPPLRPRSCMAMALRSESLPTPCRALATACSCSVGVRFFNSLRLRPSLVNASACSLPPSPASTMARCKRLMVGPTASAPAPAFWKAR